MKYPKEYLDEIKLRLKVSQIVGKTVNLKKRGKEFIGLSPFKNEKTPSFTVNDEKEFYHCFSSGEHGNIFDFLMKTKSIGFGEAVRTLAAEAGMQPYRFSNFDQKKDLRFQTYKNIFKNYSQFFHKKLYDNNNSEALDYLKKRGLSNSIIEEFKLGFVSRKNDFYNELLKNYSEDDIKLTGLFYKNEKTGQYVDRFNSRIIFPINNVSGDTIAFGGRIIQNNKIAKYINSPETEFYKKGSVLFNLDKAKDCRAETKDVIIVEGYMDVITLFDKGFKNVIANSGTTLTERQINLIWRFFSNPIICLDGDDSGQKAAERIAENLISTINENNKIYFSVMPKGIDPDEFINVNGKKGFKEFLKDKKIIQYFLWDQYLNKINPNNPFHISTFEKKVKKIAYSINDEVLKKYVLEDFLGKLKNLTPLQNTYRNFKNPKLYKHNNFKILNETKILHQRKKNLSRFQIIEFSILFLILNYLNITQKKLEELSNLIFTSEKNESLKNIVIKSFTEENSKEFIKSKIDKDFHNINNEINENTNIQMITKNKSDEEIVLLLDDLISEFKEQNNLRKIESLEKKLINNLDENSFSELVKLKSQINGD